MRLPRRLTALDQPIFWPRFGGASLIDPIRAFANSSKYRWRLWVPGVDDTILGMQTVEDQFSCRPGSVLLMIIAKNSLIGGTFTFTVIDAGSKRLLASNPMGGGTVGGANSARFGTGRSIPMIVAAPWVVSEAGVVQMRVTNLSDSPANISLALQFAEPIQ